MNISDRFPAIFSQEQQNILGRISALSDAKKKKAVLVGGVVRDMLLKTSTRDVDIMFERPGQKFIEELAKSLEGKLTSHERFLTFAIALPNGLKFDLVTAREETYAAPGQLPDVTASTIEKDLKRRDFTINAIACKLNKKNLGEVIDPFNGNWDLQNRLVRALHDQSFVDDPTRIFRAARFAARLGFKIEPETLKWISAAVSKKGPAILSPVRRRHEFELILKEENPVAALQLLKEWGALVFLHAAFDRVDLSFVRFEPQMDFDEKLVRWFQSWDKTQAEALLTDMNFEKIVKRKILTKHVQSPSNS